MMICWVTFLQIFVSGSNF